MGTSIDEFSPQFQSAINQLLARCPGVYIVSGFRSIEEQQVLYNAYLNGQGNLAAKPGSSNHGPGGHGAVDIGGDKACAHSVAAELGLGFPVDGEDWHVELLDPEAATEESKQFNQQYVEERDDPLVAAERLLTGNVVSAGIEDPESLKDAVVGNAPDGKVPVDGTTDPAMTTPAGQAAQTGAVTPMPQILATLAAAGFSGDNLVTAAAVVMAESGGIANRPGPIIPADGDLGQPLGWFQIREAFSQEGTGGWRDRAQLFDPSFNARAAFSISNGGTNWQPWEAYTNGAYQKYIDEARAALGQMGGVVPGPNARDLPPLQDDDGDPGLADDAVDLTGLLSQPDISQFEAPLTPTSPTLDVADNSDTASAEELAQTKEIV